MTTLTHLPATAAPCTPLTWNGLTGAVAAARTGAEVTEPPLGLVTTRLVGVTPARPKVQVTAIVVEDETVVTPQVPLAGDKVTTAPVAKLVPAIAKDVVELAAPVVGVTDVMVGAAPMLRVA